MTHAIPGARPSSAAGLSAQSLPTPLLPEFQQSLEDRTEVRIELGERAYPIYIGELDWAHCAQASSPKDAALALVVTNTVVAPLYLERLRAALQGVHRRVEVVVLPDGEAAKNWTSLQVLMAALAQHGGDRKTVLYALGGGVIGDLTGFAAAIWMRGVRFVQVPTTLLAQVDSSVGGKTGINLPEGKNLVGSFHQPVAVWADQTCLRTLPAREFAAGLAEVIKYGPIADAGFFEWIEAQAERLAAREPQAVQVAVRRSCEVKAAVVAADEREGGLRAILNFGHTFGHALEAGLGYGALLHGEAVAVGMAMAARLSQQTLGLPAQVVERLDAVLRRSGLPLRAPAMAPEQFLHLMRGDKKSEAGRIRYVLLSRLGAADLAWADDAAALAAVAACSA